MWHVIKPHQTKRQIQSVDAATLRGAAPSRASYILYIFILHYIYININVP